MSVLSHVYLICFFVEIKLRKLSYVNGSPTYYK